MLFLIHRTSLLQLIYPHSLDQQGSPCCHSLLTVTPSYHSKGTLISALYADKIAERVLIYAFQIPFLVSFLISLQAHIENLKKTNAM